MTSGSSNFNTLSWESTYHISCSSSSIMTFYIAVVSFFDRSGGTVSSFSQKCQYAVPARTGTL